MSSFDRSSLWPVVLITVSVLALSVTAATVDSTTGGPSDQEGVYVDPGDTGESDINVSANNRNGSGDLPSSGDSFDAKVCIEQLRQPSAIIALLLGFGFVLAGLYYRYNAATTLLAGSAITPVVAGTYFLLTNCGTQFGGASGGGGIGNPATGGSPVQAPSIPPTVLGVALVGVIGVAAVVLLSATRGNEQFEAVEEEDVDDPEAADFAAAAGRAADRIEQGNVAVDNAVYRAWLDMTTLLDMPDPESSSPMDFAETAVEFGLAEKDVMELTELFNEVRYGHMDPDRREDRAVEILRHIESEYEAVSGDVGESDGADAHEDGGEE